MRKFVIVLAILGSAVALYAAFNGAVVGTSQSTGNYGVLGNPFYGVIGDSPGAGGVGVYGRGYGGLSNAFVPSTGVYGDAYNPQGVLPSYSFAGRFYGPVVVSGTLTKTAGSFKIDHPLFPESKYLYHSFVESPDMKNIYDGVAELDEGGQAVVQMPTWFEALNTDFRYQLTCIGRSAPVYIAQEMHKNQFTIAGGGGAMKVSWQVTGVRRDPYAMAHRIPVEENKPLAEQGTFLFPELYGQPASRDVEFARRQVAAKRALGPLTR
jgi:hypothetical protein